ncbi:hypothetical protein CALVIDRAFT_180902 [Calocera viscosa TUFC12733]|uniref:Uncharacterized protein n=1 Tax=Calocera viscosa (strain TUFC12733) TaxID=1330018 RepID=A0A167L055_CALVF|nr:hypothetical protein CALVIDRAFT_180902 [Calocera viscosa TUFC12733]
MNSLSPVSPRRGAGAGRFTPSGVVDQAHESEWAHRLAGLDWDETSIVFTKRQLVDFLRYLGVHVDSNCENIAGLPRYAVFGKITSVPNPVIPGQITPSPAPSGPPTPTTAEGPAPIPVAGGFRPTHRARTSRSSLSGSPQTTGLFGPGDDVPDIPASPPAERLVREAARPTPAPRSYPPPDTAQPESSDEEHAPPVHSPLSTPPATPSRGGTVYRSRQSSGGLSSAPGVMFPIENVQHTSSGYPVVPSSSAGAGASGRESREGHAHGHVHGSRDAHLAASGSGGGGSRSRPAHGRQ